VRVLTQKVAQGHNSVFRVGASISDLIHYYIFCPEKSMSKTLRAGKGIWWMFTAVFLLSYNEIN